MTAIKDRNGYWFIKKNPITKIGVYKYLGSQISPECEPNKIYKVFRPAEELFKKETLESFPLLPLVNDHEMLGRDIETNTEFTPAEKKGVEGVLGEQLFHDEDTIYSDIKIYSENLKEQIRNGKKELSLGYFCSYDKQEGTYKGQKYDYIQRNIIGNHIALVDRGRMGSDVRVYDHNIDNKGVRFAMDSIDITMDKDEDIQWITVKGTHIPIKNGENKGEVVKKFFEEKRSSSLEGAHKEWYGQDSIMEYKKIQGEEKMEEQKKKTEATDEDKRKLIDEIGGILKDKVSEEDWRTIVGKIEKIAYNGSTDDAEKAVEKSEKKEDEKNGQETQTKDKCGKDKEFLDEDVEKEDIKEVKKAIDEMPEKIMRAIAERDNLGRKVENLVGTFDYSKMTTRDVAKYACDKLDIQVQEGQEIATIDGYLAGVKRNNVSISYKLDIHETNSDKAFDKFMKGE